MEVPIKNLHKTIIIELNDGSSVEHGKTNMAASLSISVTAGNSKITAEFKKETPHYIFYKEV